MPEDRISDPPAPVHADAPAPDYATTSHLMLFFAPVYVVEGIGQIGGLIAQPLTSIGLFLEGSPPKFF